MRGFLTDVADWLSQPCPESLTGYEFGPTDGPYCRENFIITEEVYLEGKDGFEADAVELDMFYEDILVTMWNYDLTLVNNEDFLNFISEGRDVSEFNEDVRNKFFSSNGATPYIENKA